MENSMSALATIRGGLVIGVLIFAPFLGTANAQGKVAIEKVSFKVTDAFEPGAAVVGELRIPASKRDRLPAVLIVNSSPGFDGRGAFYAEALNQAAIATLEIDMLQGRPGATFGWDSRFSSAFYSAGANKDKGGIVNVIANEDIANRSREFAVGYFRKNLGAD
jgi:hypothetical protein